MTDAAKKLKKITVGGYANFYTGKDAAANPGTPLIAKRYQGHPRERIWIQGQDIVDMVDDDQSYLIETLDTPAPDALKAQNTFNPEKGIGMVHCSYILAYALAFKFSKGIQKTTTVKKTDETGTAYEIQTQSYEQITPVDNISFIFTKGTSINAPDVAQSKVIDGKNTYSPKIVTGLSMGVPGKLVDNLGNYIRVSQKISKKTTKDSKPKVIGLGITESYFEQMIASSSILTLMISSFSLKTETARNVLKPKLDFKSALTPPPQATLMDAELVDAQLVDAQLILPPAKVVWNPRMSVGATLGFKDNIIPMRVPRTNLDGLIFDDLI